MGVSSCAGFELVVTVVTLSTPQPRFPLLLSVFRTGSGCQRVFISFYASLSFRASFPGCAENLSPPSRLTRRTRFCHSAPVGRAGRVVHGGWSAPLPLCRSLGHALCCWSLGAVFSMTPPAQLWSWAQLAFLASARRRGFSLFPCPGCGGA